MTEVLTHCPVMLHEVCAAVRGTGTASPPRIIDATLGRGGYTRTFLENPPTHVLAIDRDQEAIDSSHTWAHAYGARLFITQGCFSELADQAKHIGMTAVCAVVFDLGVSSPQIDNPTRGFSFRHDGPLDMRMTQTTGVTAADIVNQTPEHDLARILFEFGGERYARRVARRIVAERIRQPFTRTVPLAEVVRASVPRSRDGLDPATRTFQALRIAVNREYDELIAGLCAAERVLRTGGRLVVVSFHSGEDALVKQFMRTRSASLSGNSRHAPPRVPFSDVDRSQPTFRLIGKSQTPSLQEIRRNPRAASARLRIAERTAAPAWDCASPNILSTLSSSHRRGL